MSNMKLRTPDVKVVNLRVSRESREPVRRQERGIVFL